MKFYNWIVLIIVNFSSYEPKSELIDVNGWTAEWMGATCACGAHKTNLSLKVNQMIVKTNKINVC